MINKNLSFKAPRQKRIKMSNAGGTKKIKWWHILLIVLGVLVIAAGIAVAIIFGRFQDKIEDFKESVGGDAPIIGGNVESTGIYATKDNDEYVLCEYTELSANEKVVLLQKANEVRFDGKAYYVFVSADGTLNYQFSGEYTGKYTPEQVKADLFSLLKSVLGYTDEKLEGCDVLVFDPVSFTKVKLSSVEVLDDGDAAIKFSAGAIDGELSEECTLNGSYTKTENEFSFTFNELPEDEVLKGVAEKLLTKATYKSYIMYGEWQNTLTFGDSYTLYLEAEQK